MNDALTETAAIRQLRKAGFPEDFRVEDDRLRMGGTKESFPPEELRIREVLRVEGASDVDDGAAVYGVETIGGRKGVLLVPFGPQVTPGLGEVVRRLRRDP
jgi:hypothetical protein